MSLAPNLPPRPTPPQKPAPPPAASVDKLKAERVELLLAQIPGWKLSFDQKALTRSFQFPTTEKAFAFVNLVASLAFRRNQYPEVRFQRETVTLSLSNPKVGGLTLLDFALARQIQQAG